VLREELAGWAGVLPEKVGLVRSPYRVCPLGAHVDHQMGQVTGLALDRALLLAFSPRDDAKILLRSHQYEGTAEMALDSPPGQPLGDWADYMRGAVLALEAEHQLHRGMAAIVDGHGDVGGLSSSAAVGVAYLLALEAVNGLSLTPRQNIDLDRVLENDYIGLDNGILDQSSILLGRQDQLMHMDCRTGKARLLPLGGRNEAMVAVLFSGLRTPLTDSDYNQRVAECRQAAALLLKAAGRQLPKQPVLRDVPEQVFREHVAGLPTPLRLRAQHFFGEQQRVERGVDLWQEGRLEEFGRLMTESGHSSVENYECGNRYLRTAFDVLRTCEGVYGARFSGAGFRGCCIGLCDPEFAPRIRAEALERYRQEHPDMAAEAAVYFCRSADGAGLIA